MKQHWSKLKEWWSHLAVREQKAISVGTIFLGLFVIYQGLWSPIVDHVAFLRQQIAIKEKLLAWMQMTDKRIQQLENHSQSREKVSSPAFALGHLQKRIHQARLDSQLSQLRQVSADSVEMHFQKVEFDKFIRLVVKIVTEQRMAISQLSVRVEGAPGIVTTEVVFRVLS